MIVRSLRAGHPVPIAITMVGERNARPDRLGVRHRLGRNDLWRPISKPQCATCTSASGIDDLPLFVTAVAIQRSTGGNLGEILENLSSVIRDRFKMRRKIRALAAEGRASALILSSLPIGMFAVIHFLVPSFYASVWDQNLTKIALTLAGCWMSVGNFIMYRMVNFRI